MLFFSILSEKVSTSNVRFITCNLKYYFFSSEMIPSVIPKATPCMRFAIMRFTPYSMLCTIHWLTLLSLTSRPSIGNMFNESR